MLVNQQTVTQKLLTIVGTISALVLIIIGRLSYLQITLADLLQVQSAKNFLRYEQTKCLRGSIFDCNGKLLATNKPVTNVYFRGLGNKTITPEQQTIIAKVAEILGDSFESECLLDHAERKATKVLLGKNISFEQLSKIAEQFSGNPCISIETDFARLYPYKAMASHILGYLGNLESGIAGKMGLERLFESSLKGKHGVTQKILNSFGKHLSEQHIQESLAGQDLTVTLDASLQKIAEMLFGDDKKGIFILMDSSDGSLRVALSKPDFDPNLFAERMDPTTWQELHEKRPFLNRIHHACYPPGSIFKLITLTAALETKTIDYDDIWNCRGSVTVGKRKFRCHRKEGHGPLSAAQAIAKSCNIMFYKLAQQIDIDIIAQYAGKFGLGKSTGTVFNDAPGLVPNRAWKSKTKGERWWLGETMGASIGQSYLLTTPLQIARMVAGIHVGYLVTPRIMEESSIIYEPLAISHQTRLFLQETMKEVTEDGTAKTLSKLKNFQIAAKTSTAQTSILDKRELGEQFLEHGWVTVNFQYKDGPKMTMVVLVEHAGNARLSLMIAKSFLKAYGQLYDVRSERHKKN